MIQLLWFCLAAIMIAGYVVLDGFDLGAGAIHLLVARNPAERKLILRSIGPVWDGNEVWLLAGGGTLFMAFPALYASSFSGFYLPLMIVLWLLILRGVSIEFRNRVDSPVWAPLWDGGFCFSSLLLAVFFGAALGNVVRGVPLDASGNFFLPLWTDFTPGPQPGVLDWYTILIGVLALAALSLHGALWVRYKTAGELNARSGTAAGRLWWLLGLLTLLATAASFSIQPQIPANFRAHPWGAIFPLLAIAGFVGMRRAFEGLARTTEPRSAGASRVPERVEGLAGPVRAPYQHRELAAFLSSCAYLVGMLTSAAFGVFPYVLPSVPARERGLTIYSAATGDYGLHAALVWFIPGMLLAAGYTVFVYRKFAGKVS